MTEPTFKEMLDFAKSKNITKLVTKDITYLDLNWTLSTYEQTVNEQLSKGFRPNECDICLKVKANLKEIYTFLKNNNIENQQVIK
jgi:hypothetical protein